MVAPDEFIVPLALQDVAEQVAEEIDIREHANTQSVFATPPPQATSPFRTYANSFLAVAGGMDDSDSPEPILDMTEARSRQAELVDSEIFTNPITVIGAGAIGSFTVLTLAKIGFTNITVYDDDIVSVENISNQFYRYRDIRTLKTIALRDMVRDFERITIQAWSSKWNRAIPIKGYIIMAVDNMAVRNEVYKFVKRNADVYGFIDGRMGGQQAEVYSVDLLQPEQKKVYEKYLWSDTEASDLPCTQKAVMYNVLWIASMIVNNLRLMLEEKPFPQVMHMDFENVNHMNVTQAEE